MSNGQPPSPSDFPPPGSSYPPSQPGYPTGVPEKKSRTPWIVGGCGCIALITLATVGTLLVFYYIGKEAKEKATGGGQSGGSGGMTTYVSTPENIPAGLRDKFVPFQFQYPSKFRVEPSEKNFIKVEESLTENGASFTMENFAVGYITMPSADADNNKYYPELLNTLSKQLAGQFTGYREIGQTPETVAGQRGRLMTFQAMINNTPLFGKMILVREPTNPRGVLMILMATPKDPAVKSVADVGVKGDLAGILSSFKFLPTR